MMPQLHMDTTRNRKDSMKTASLAGRRCRYSMGACALNRGMLVLCSVLALMLAGCTSESNKPEEPPQPEKKGPELILTRSGFQKVYIAARGCISDALPYRFASVSISY